MIQFIQQTIKTEPEFDLEIHILEQRLKQAQANTDLEIRRYYNGE